jgi:hypothetical protein
MSKLPQNPENAGLDVPRLLQHASEEQIIELYAQVERIARGHSQLLFMDLESQLSGALEPLAPELPFQN